MVGGYMGKVLRVDLETGKSSVQTFAGDVLQKYIGGSGLGAKILYDETTAATNPLGPENLLIFLTGPLTGTAAPNFGRHQVITKSPLTGIYGEANSGGKWGVKLKQAGYDGIIVVGRADQPVYLWVHDGECEIRNAGHLWGKDTWTVDRMIKGETDPTTVIASIGQAGEQLVRISAIMNDGKDSRAAARCGVGAVMGSKNLKAVAVNGSMPTLVHDKQRLITSVRSKVSEIRTKAQGLGEFGTSVGMMASEAIGNLPIKNWQQGKWTKGAELISGQTMAKTILTDRYYCAGCVIGCGRIVQVTSGAYAGDQSAGPEYESLGMLGANCLIDDLEALAKANDLCNRYGLDTISAGAVIAFAMECFEHGLITEKDTGGLQLKWGDPVVMIEMIKKIALREDIGWLLGEGVKRAAENIGGIAPEFAVHAKGLEFPAHDPRAKYGNALAYATSARGACHLNAFSFEFENGISMSDLGYPSTLERFDHQGKGKFVASFQDLQALFDSLVGCKFLVFGGVTVNTLVEWLNDVTGWEFSRESLLETGSRIVNLKRLYNVRQGVSRQDDTISPRILTQMRGEGGAAENLPPLGQMLNEYYHCRGWDEFGIPLPETLASLGLT